MYTHIYTLNLGRRYISLLWIVVKKKILESGFSELTSVSFTVFIAVLKFKRIINKAIST